MSVYFQKNTPVRLDTINKQEMPINYLANRDIRGRSILNPADVANIGAVNDKHKHSLTHYLADSARIGTRNIVNQVDSISTLTKLASNAALNSPGAPHYVQTNASLHHSSELISAASENIKQLVKTTFDQWNPLQWLKSQAQAVDQLLNRPGDALDQIQAPVKAFSRAMQEARLASEQNHFVQAVAGPRLTEMANFLLVSPLVTVLSRSGGTAKYLLPIEPLQSKVLLRTKDITISLPNKSARLQAGELVRDNYAHKSYQTHALKPPKQHSANEFTLVGTRPTEPNEVITTMTFRMDQGRGSLAADTPFSDILNQLRKDGKSFLEMGRLATASNYQGRQTLPTITSMTHMAGFHASSSRGITDLLIEVNPRHQGFYNALGFKVVDQNINPTVGAESILMTQRINEHVTRESGQRSLRTFIPNIGSVETAAIELTKALNESR